MSVHPHYTTIIKPGTPYYRITSRHRCATGGQVADGEGARLNRAGARYNRFLVPAVYLGETVAACMAEKMFYFHQSLNRALSALDPPAPVPSFEQTFALCEIYFDHDIADVFDMFVTGANSFAQIYRCMVDSPWTDYEHLKKRREDLEFHGYKGVRAPSSRQIAGEPIVVLFNSQSSHVVRMNVFDIDFRLITNAGAPFLNHMIDDLDNHAGQVRLRSSAVPLWGTPYTSWTKVQFIR